MVVHALRIPFVRSLDRWFLFFFHIRKIYFCLLNLQKTLFFRTSDFFWLHLNFFLQTVNLYFHFLHLFRCLLATFFLNSLISSLYLKYPNISAPLIADFATEILENLFKKLSTLFVLNEWCILILISFKV